MPAPYTAKGWTATFDSSSFDMDMVSIKPPNPSAEPIPTTHLGTEGGALTFKASDFYDGGEMTLTGFYDPSEDIPVNVDDTVTITFTGTGSTPAEWSFDCVITGYEPGDSTFNQRSEATLTLKISGEITVTAATE